MDHLSHDPIPNIRFNVAKSYAILVDVLKRLPESGTMIDVEKKGGGSEGGSARGRELVQQQILPTLEKLQEDQDVDVRYYATTAAQAWGDEMRLSP